VLVETKPHGAALHYRLAPAEEAGAVALAGDLATSLGLHLQPGKMMIEVRGRGSDKGDAVRALMREPAFAGSIPFFIGDDFTDEPAFEACAGLGGAGILVGRARVSAARFILSDVAAVHAWLSEVQS
jgi:trehalose 6-phosphate phosphatase